jgi:hypothetical protein
VILQPEATPIPKEVVSLPVVGKQAWFTAGDFLYFVSFTGIYSFDGANVSAFGDINNLFNPANISDLQVDIASLAESVLGSDATHLWFTYRTVLGNFKTFKLLLREKKWLEESTTLFAHETEHLLPYHIAGATLQILSLQASPALVSITVTTLTKELSEIAQVACVAIEYATPTVLAVGVYLDEVLVETVALAPRANRGWAFIPIASLLAKRIALAFGTADTQAVSIYTATVHYVEYPSTSHWISGAIALGAERGDVIEATLSLLAVTSGEVEIMLRLDNQIMPPRVARLVAGIPTVVRVPLAFVGQIAQLEVQGVEFIKLSSSLAIAPMGAEVRYVEIP